MDNEFSFHSNGKLLISGEYLVLTGAKALALPVRFGQSIQIKSNNIHTITWISSDPHSTWFSCKIDPTGFKILQTSNHSVSEYLKELLLACRRLNPGFLTNEGGMDIMIQANYPLNWGLGSSSTLIALVAGLAKVDKLKLFRSVSNGSGYDLACTDRNSLLFYQLNNEEVSIDEAEPGKALLNHACFAYLGNKQETAGEVISFLSNKNFTDADIDRISELSMQICKTDDVMNFCALVEEHEEILSRILLKEKISKQFPDFPGSVKSLGAWGGDFAMFTSKLENREIKAQLVQLGFNVIFTFDELKIIMD